MISLLIVADDFTGALDTGVQFAKSGIRTTVTLSLSPDFAQADAQVLVVDAESRHLPPEEAFGRVRAVTEEAKKAGVSFFYKKTDSVLRGNIGAELEAMLAGAGERNMAFVPAYPKAGRTTEAGVQLLDGTPVADSVFGRDPFEPVKHSALAEIIGAQSSVQVVNVSDVGAGLKAVNEPDAGAGLKAVSEPDADAALKADAEIVGGERIFVYDAASDTDLARISLAPEMKTFHVFAGCAGFAEYMPVILSMEKTSGEARLRADSLLSFSGSLSPVTFAQIRRAEKAGFRRVTLTEEQRMEEDYVDSPAFAGFSERIRAMLSSSRGVILEAESSEKSQEETLSADADNEAVRARVAGNLGRLIAGMLLAHPAGAYVIVGGDTLHAVIRALHAESILPLAEITPGVVLSEVRRGSETWLVASKAGGLGGEDVFDEIARAVGLEKSTV